MAPSIEDIERNLGRELDKNKDVLVDCDGNRFRVIESRSTNMDHACIELLDRPAFAGKINNVSRKLDLFEIDVTKTE